MSPFPIVTHRGNTRYRLDVTPSGYVEFTRDNAAGQQVTFFPVEMLHTYARAWAKRHLAEVVDKVLGG